MSGLMADHAKAEARRVCRMVRVVAHHHAVGDHRRAGDAGYVLRQLGTRLRRELGTDEAERAWRAGRRWERFGRALGLRCGGEPPSHAEEWDRMHRVLGIGRGKGEEAAA